MAFIVSNAVSNPTSLPRIVIGQWLNQTQNAAITWYNRPHCKAFDTGKENLNPRRALAAYCAACATAIPVAVGAGLASQRSLFLKPFARFAPYPGVVLANVLNTCMMRSDDLCNGVAVMNQNGVCLGSSHKAGLQAVRETSITRTLIPLANFVVAPILVAALGQFRKGKPKSMALQVGVTAGVLIT